MKARDNTPYDAPRNANEAVPIPGAFHATGATRTLRTALGLIALVVLGFGAFAGTKRANAGDLLP